MKKSMLIKQAGFYGQDLEEMDMCQVGAACTHQH
jgi:hypothetical protein